MRMKPKDRWRCTNLSYGCEILVESLGSKEGTNPVCSCGAPMKKKYVAPVLTYLDFLRLEELPNVTAREE